MASRLLGWIATAALVAVAGSAAAQQTDTRITRAQSQVLIDMPELGTGARERYDYIGWNARYSVERHYAVALAARGDLPRAQINMRVLSKGFVWTANSLDEAYLRDWPFLKDRSLRVIRPASAITSAEIQTMWFESGDAECVAFNMRRVARGLMDSQPEAGTAGFDGFYCAAAGTKMTEALADAVLGGIDYRAGGEVRRAHGADQRPIPARLLGGGATAPLAPPVDPA